MLYAHTHTDMHACIQWRSGTLTGNPEDKAQWIKRVGVDIIINKLATGDELFLLSYSSLLLGPTSGLQALQIKTSLSLLLPLPVLTAMHCLVTTTSSESVSRGGRGAPLPCKTTISSE